jgi:predicted transcriptional regulator
MIILLKRKYLYMITVLYKYRGIIIKQSAVDVLDEKDLEIIETLRSLKVPKNVATLITYLANINEANSREIEIATGMRQPEASTAMHTLRQNNWATEREVQTERKGLPMKVYKLIVPLDKIVQHYEDTYKRESARAMASIQRLKELTAT